MKIMLRILFLLQFIFLSSFVIQSQNIKERKTKDSLKAAFLAETDSIKTNKITAVDSIAKIEIDSSAVYYFVGSIDSLALGKLHHIDTMLTKFHEYDPSFSNNNYFVGKGNIGQHVYKLNYDYTPTEGFNYTNSTIDLYAYKNSKTRYYQLIKPFTKLYYVQGPVKEKTLEVLHTQNIMPRLNAGIKFRFLTAPGTYEHQKTENKNLSVTLRYRTANSRYGFILNYINNKFETEENGGISADSLFEKNLEVNRLLIPVNLNEAENLEIKNSFRLNHYFNIGKPKTIIKDSLDNIIDRKGFSFGRLTHSMTYEKHRMSYSDNLNSNDSLFYQPKGLVTSTIYDNPIHNNITFDSTSISKLENQITWSNLDYDDDPENKALYLYFGLKSQIIKISDAHTVYDTLTTRNHDDGSEILTIFDTISINKRTYNQLIPKAGFSIFAFKSSRLNVDGSYVMNGYNSGDVTLKASLSQYLGSKDKNWGLLSIESAYIKKTPDWFYTYHIGNNLRWENDDFNKENILTLTANYKYKGLYLSASYTSFGNYVYLDDSAHPRQLTTSTSLTTANLRYVLKYRKWSFDVDLIYQKSDGNYINRPELIGNSSIYFTNSIFGGAAILQPGIEIFYYTAYFADAYSPAIRSFYTQNDEKIGNKIFASIFLNVKIKRTLFFIKSQHTNAKYSKAYYASPGYPMQDVVIKFGVSWRFYD